MGLYSFVPSSATTSQDAVCSYLRDTTKNHASALGRRSRLSLWSGSMSKILLAVTFVLVLFASQCSPAESAALGSRRRRCDRISWLLTHLNLVREYHHGVFTQFKESRFNNLDVTSANIIIPNLPTVNDLAPQSMDSISVHDRLPEYYQVLLQFKSAFQRLINDEVLLRGIHSENDLDTFVEEFEQIHAHMVNCITIIDEYLFIHGLVVNTTLTNHPVFDNADDEQVISTRNLRVLEEFKECIPLLITVFGLLDQDGHIPH